MNPKIEHVFVCPDCKIRLIKSQRCFKCPKCDYEYTIINKIPVIIKESSLDPFKKGESEFHTLIAKNADDAHALDSLRVKYLHDDFLNHIRSLPQSSTILDACCGSGEDILALSKENYRVFGVDISYGMIEVTYNKLIKHGINPRLAVADVENLPFKSDFFDVIYICGALHHTNPKKTLLEFKRCLKKEGIIVVGSEPNSWQYKFKSLKKSKLGMRIIKIFRNDYTVDKNSPGDEKTKGFSKEYFESISDELDLEIISIKPIWFFNGFLSLLKLRPPKKIEKGFILIDKILSKTPLINKYAWKWNLVLKLRSESE
ncbi:methyltransferase domain-containing protein [Methanothermobacter marburgensis]|uniref:Predicted methyltransferase n=1 Tax=Methanothermobacter marburgensis (strain ATCC BAA-927 / DSM 2133 / JCM 14651 / NBRC 100331 / OCM 82 / Marburg) TaxID=79929 RepID=D9PVW2_METTM|nr:methyltransferase domain-containing protein [Methanothermobacter marburgensis]ADL58360.1 predicted methyltransferase [Methanothermobacter marburgensis str. Marburg]WBF10508.1 methyltransferase domain-containing protein [Methanothermobacter marburgensis]